MHISELVSYIGNNNNICLGKYKFIFLISGLGVGGVGLGSYYNCIFFLPVLTLQNFIFQIKLLCVLFNTLN